jgi:hypothetical protein
MVAAVGASISVNQIGEPLGLHRRGQHRHVAGEDTLEQGRVLALQERGHGLDVGDIRTHPAGCESEAWDRSNSEQSSPGGSPQGSCALTVPELPPCRAILTTAGLTLKCRVETVHRFLLY